MFGFEDIKKSESDVRQTVDSLSHTAGNQHNTHVQLLNVKHMETNQDLLNKCESLFSRLCKLDSLWSLRFT